MPLHHDPAGFGAGPGTGFGDAQVPQRVAAQLFGPGTLLETLRETTDPEDPARPVLDATTGRGSFRLEWPGGRLLSSTAADAPAGAESLTQDQLLKSGADFAAAWFPEVTTAASPTLTPADGGYLVSYRRYNADHVLMPMGLDVTVSAAGRVTASVARRDADPRLPHPTVTEDAAKQQAAATVPGSRADTALLLAKKVDGQWRPCWSVGLVAPGGAKGTAVFVDAVTGRPVPHQG